MWMPFIICMYRIRINGRVQLTTFAAAASAAASAAAEGW